jgi:hypothetical protein
MTIAMAAGKEGCPRPAEAGRLAGDVTTRSLRDITGPSAFID